MEPSTPGSSQTGLDLARPSWTIACVQTGTVLTDVFKIVLRGGTLSRLVLVALAVALMGWDGVYTRSRSGNP